MVGRIKLRRMKPDIYTKIVLTVIALTLLIVARNRYVHPATTARAGQPMTWSTSGSNDNGCPGLFVLSLIPVSAIQWGNLK
jgi:hypothetical protein